MRFFFRSKQFKIILAILISLITLSVIFSVIGSSISPQSNVVGTITAPIRSAVSSISHAVSDFFTALSNGNEIMLENTELETQISELREKLVDYEKITKENEFYKNYLEIKDQNPDFKFAPATLIARDNSDPYKAFVINKGSADGIAAQDPVITEAGLVGYVSEVGLTTSKITTILSPDLTLGALDNRTNDSGIISGSLETNQKNCTKFKNLAHSCSVAVGDYVVTSGEGVFPKGLLIGTIETIANDKYNTSLYASVKPFVDLDQVRNVMVITSFKGQGDVLPSGDK
ncbi:MAG: rod shape-determining protein MreC [Ruminococcaceae bacterium]|nr:rod shape-determining protein MreC [Oscillospiraceae bacterium]